MYSIVTVHFTTANCRHLIRFSLHKILSPLSLLSYLNPRYFLGKIMYSIFTTNIHDQEWDHWSRVTA